MKRFSIFAVCLLALILSTSAFAQTAPIRSARHQARKLKRMDINRDGQITRGEWRGRERRFERLDRNNDGVISKRDLRNRRHKI